jgi:dTDP-4-dehydrorhamnose reductase
VKILLTGRNGQVGWELERTLAGLGELTATDRQTLDLSSADAIRRIVREVKPALIVNAAAYTAVDRAEVELDAARRINAVAPGVFAEEARRLGALLVHYSTDYVFDGQKRAPYLETDPANPVNTYGRSKFEGEQRLQQAGCRYVLLRTSWVYAPRGKNFFLAIAAKARAGEPLRVVADQEGVPTESRFLADVTRRLIESDAEGIFNAVPCGTTTWHGFAVQIITKLGLTAPVQPIPTSAYPVAAPRPGYSVLSNEKLTRLLGPAPCWQSALDRCVAAFNAAVA